MSETLQNDCEVVAGVKMCLLVLGAFIRKMIDRNTVLCADEGGEMAGVNPTLDEVHADCLRGKSPE